MEYRYVRDALADALDHEAIEIEDPDLWAEYQDEIEDEIDKAREWAASRD